MKFAFLSQQTVILLSVVFATTESLADATTPASILRRRDGSSNHDVAVRGSSSSSSNTSTAAVRGRQLKGTKKSKKTTTSDPPEEDEHNVDSCSYQSKNFECDGPGTVAICYKHDDHYHNKCVDATHEDIYNKVPGSGEDNNLYKDKYELLNCGCCPTDVPADMVIRDNIMVTDATDGEYIEVKYPKSFCSTKCQTKCGAFCCANSNQSSAYGHTNVWAKSWAYCWTKSRTKYVGITICNTM